MRRESFPALAGLLGPLAFLTGLAVASRTQQEFMASYDWSIWPAGLALGPHGWLWGTAAVVFGLLLLTFAVAVARDTVRSPVAGCLIGLAGVGAVLSAFPTDLVKNGSRTETANPFNAPTWQGLVHGSGALALLLCLLVVYVPLWRKAKRLSGWRLTRTASAWALLLLVPAVALPDSRPVGGYAFLVVIFAPLAVIGVRLAVRTASSPNSLPG